MPNGRLGGPSYTLPITLANPLISLSPAFSPLRPLRVHLGRHTVLQDDEGVSRSEGHRREHHEGQPQDHELREAQVTSPR